MVTDNTCFFERAREHYNNPGLGGREVGSGVSLKSPSTTRSSAPGSIRSSCCPLFGVLSDRNDRRDHCAVCADRADCGGCRARAFAYLGDIRPGDPGCERSEELWDKLAATNESLIAIAEGPRPNSTDNVTA